MASRSAERAEPVGVRRVFRRLKRHQHVRLGGEIIDFVGLRLLHDADDVGGVGHVAIFRSKATPFLVRIVIEMIDPRGVE